MTARQPAERWSSWQAMDSGRLLLFAAAGMLTVAAVAHTATVHIRPPAVHVAVAFGILIALGELLRLALPGGREAAPIAIAGAMAYALLLYVKELPGPRVPLPPRVSALQVIAVTAIGMTIGALPHMAAGRSVGVTGMASRLVAVSCVAFIFRSLTGIHLIVTQWWLAASVMTVLLAFGCLIDAVIGALIRADDLGARFGVALWDELRVQWPLALAVGASAMIIAFATESMGIAGLAVFVAPLLVTQLAFRRYAGIRSTYLQTVRALARVTEVGGYVESGHSHRVSVLAVAVGRELGMTEPDLLDLEYAALMHDIGQLSLRDPIPGGATVLVSRGDQQRIAELGADVIAKAGVLDRVAELVRCQSLPARGYDPPPPVGSRIIRAANAFDDLVGGSTDRDRSTAALERLRLDTSSEYDAGVVEALSEVAGRRRSSRL
jgi:HD domain